MNEIIRTVIITICAMIAAYYTVKGSIRLTRQDIKDNKAQTKAETIVETKVNAVIETKLDYVAKGIDDIKLDYREQSRHINSLDLRLVAAEESTKSAHKRIDELVK